MKKISFFSILVLMFFSPQYAQTPSIIICPCNGTDWYNVPGSPAHTESGGIGGADDRNALDYNKPNDENSVVYAPGVCYIERNLSGWSGSSYGQLLLKFKNIDGSVFYLGILHMKDITSLKATQGAYVNAGTVLGKVSNVGVPTAPAHLHFAVYTMEGGKLRSKTVSIFQVPARPNIGIVGNATINGISVNYSPFPVARNTPFTMALTVRNNGTASITGTFYLILSADNNGSQFVGKVGELFSTLGVGQQKLMIFYKSALTSPSGIYWLHLYYDDGGTGGSALKRVTGFPIAINLQ